MCRNNSRWWGCRLHIYGMEDKVLNWISAFLSQCTQVVKVNGEESSVGQVLSGIPQGSVLGPILFVIYINDILEITKSDGLLFSDDTSRKVALSLQAVIEMYSKKGPTLDF